MPILQTPFTCSNGHSFTANAKIRARCPDCGVTARKDFSAPTEPSSQSAEPKSHGIKEVKLVRQGKPRTAKTIKKPPVARVKPNIVKPTLKKVSGGTVKVSSVPKGTTPTIKKPPSRTNVSKQAKSAAEGAGARSESYFDRIRRVAMGR